MRDGKYIGTWEINNVKIDELISYMVGRDMKERFPASDCEPGEDVILKVKDFTQ